MPGRDRRHSEHDAPTGESRSRASEAPGRHGVPPAQALTAQMVVANGDPAPALPTGIEGTPQQHEADRFLAIVRTELQRWKAFRTNWRGELPGGPAFDAALSFGRGMGGHLEPSTGELAPDSDRPLRQYLRRALGGDELQVLQQMVGFNEGDTRRGALAEAFGIPPLHVVHTYVLTMRAVQTRAAASRGSGGSVQAEVGVSGGVAGRVFTLVYSNNLGMTYRHRMSGLNATVGVGVSISGSVEPGGGTDVGGATEMDSSSADSRPVNPGYFWAPEWFDGTYVVRSVQAGAEGTNGGGGGHGVGVTLTAGSFTQITFFHESQSVDFNFPQGPGANATVNAGRSVTPRVALTAGADVGIGHAFGEGTRGSAPVQHSQLRHPVKTGEMFPLIRAWIDFETESADVSPAGNAMLVTLVETVRDYAARYPDADFATAMIADASPRWRGARSDAEANELNARLSSARARTAQDRLRVAIEQVIGVSPEHGEYREEATVYTRGSEDARVHHGAGMADNSQQYRRVHVTIEASRYREGEP